MKNTLIINGHEKYPFAKGELNSTFVSVAKETLVDLGHTVKVLTIEDGFDSETTVQDFFWADNIIFQTPVYWFNLPGLFKKFIDEVYNQGLMRFIDLEAKDKEYGSTGNLNNKKYMLSTTWNAPKNMFNNPNAYLMQDKNVDDVFISLHLSNRYLGMEKLPTFATYDIYHNPSIGEDLENFKEHLKINLN